MNVEEYLEATTGGVADVKLDNTDAVSEYSDLDPVEGAKTKASNHENDSNGGLGDVTVAPEAAEEEPRWSDMSASFLHGDLEKKMGVSYLSVVTKKDGDAATAAGTVVKGKILTPPQDHTHYRWVVSLDCRRAIACPPGVDMDAVVFPDFRHVLFVIDTSSPNSYLSVEAMQVLSTSSDMAVLKEDADADTASNDNLSISTIPDALDVQLSAAPEMDFEFFLSPASCSEINILGANLLAQVDIVTKTREKEFTMQFLTATK